MLEEIKGMIAETFGADAAGLSEETSVMEDLDADSLDLFELISEVEDKYDVKIPDEELENMKTIGDVVKFLEANK